MQIVRPEKFTRDVNYTERSRTLRLICTARADEARGSLLIQDYKPTLRR